MAEESSITSPDVMDTSATDLELAERLCPMGWL